MTTEGKSTLARALCLTAAPPRLVIDPVGSAITASIPGTVTFSDPGRLPEADTARFVPRDPEDLEAYGVLYGAIRARVLEAFRAGDLERARCWVWCDEAGFVLPVERTPPQARSVVAGGAKLMIGHLAINMRPRGVYRHAIAQAAHVAIWDLGLKEDRQYLAGVAGIPFELLEQGLAARGERGCLWWNRRAKTLTPLQVELR